uniref:SET domain-containing protein n=1 Tax=Mycena chlorophos TaxID=658473 RepID=A0ABQ0LYM5_MYCCL|nr:predicted protein [Mycena chlorophos]
MKRAVRHFFRWPEKSCVASREGLLSTTTTTEEHVDLQGVLEASEKMEPSEVEDYLEEDEMLYCAIPSDSSSSSEVTECLFTSKRVLNAVPNLPQPANPPINPPWRLDQCSGKGMALFATRDIKQGELVSDRRPLLLSSIKTPVLCPSLAGVSDEKELDRVVHQAETEILESLVNRMRPENRAAYMRLANTDPESPPSSVRGIHDTNAVGIMELNQNGEAHSTHTCVCEVYSRLNHSCSPNTERRFHLPSFSFQIYAVRNIRNGQELTSSYSDLLAPACERRVFLRNRYGFVCRCSACLEPRASDVRRAQLDDEEEDFDLRLVIQWCKDASLPENWLIKKCLKHLELIEAEDLQVLDTYWELLATLARAYLCLGDVETAREWAGRARRCAWIHPYRRDAQDLEDILAGKYEQLEMWRMRT